MARWHSSGSAAYSGAIFACTAIFLRPFWLSLAVVGILKISSRAVMRIVMRARILLRAVREKILSVARA